MAIKGIIHKEDKTIINISACKKGRNLESKIY